jgi:hypothetical protein
MRNVARRVDDALKAILSDEPLERRIRNAAGFLALIEGEKLGQLSEEAQKTYHEFFEKVCGNPSLINEAAEQLRYFIYEAASEVEIERFVEKQESEVAKHSKN